MFSDFDTQIQSDELASIFEWDTFLNLDEE